jgi:hypothetical protein
MLIILTLTALHMGSPLYAYSSPEEVFSMPPSADEQNAWQEISIEPTSEPVNTVPTEEPESPSQQRVFYKYGEVKTITPPPVEETIVYPSEENFSTENGESSSVIIAEPVSETPVNEPEPLPLREEELLVPNQPAPVVAPKSSWEMPSIPMPLLLAGGVTLLGMIAYWIWRIVPRFKTTMSKEAISPPPVDLKSLDANQMARLKTALGEKPK